LKFDDYFQNININVVFLLNMFLFYMKNSFKYLRHVRCEFYVLIFAEANFHIPILECQYDKVLKTRDYFQNININVVFQLNIFYFICKTPLNICIILVVVVMCLYMWKWIFMYRYEKVDTIRFWKLVTVFKISILENPNL